MTHKVAVNWLINITADIGKIQHQDLWHYEQALSEIREMLEAEPERKTGHWIEFDSDEDRYDVIKCQCCKHTFTVDSYHWTDIEEKLRQLLNNFE